MWHRWEDSTEIQRKQVSTMQHMEMEGPRYDPIELRVTPQEKALLLRAAAIEHLDITSFVMRIAVLAAQEVIERTEHNTQQMQPSKDDHSQHTGEDLIAFFRNSPLADVALELERELERDKAANRATNF